MKRPALALLMMLTADAVLAQSYPGYPPGYPPSYSPSYPPGYSGGNRGGAYVAPYPGDEPGPRYLRPYRDRGDDEPEPGWQPPDRRYGAPQEPRPSQQYRPNARPPADEDDEPRQRRRSVDADEPRGQKIMDGGQQPDIPPIPPQRVFFSGKFAPGTIIIETSGRQLLLVTSSREALRYPISVGRQGFTWTGTERIARIAEWPDWHPPEQMRERDPKLPEKMTGGLRNPLGAKALYLGDTLYRIHGTNDAKSIGHASSSGCFRMLNGHVVDLADRVKVGTPVVVVERLPREIVSPAPERYQQQDPRQRYRY